MDKYTQEQIEIRKAGKKQIFKIKIIGIALTFAILLIGIILLLKVKKLVLLGLFMCLVLWEFPIASAKRKINNIEYTMNFQIEEIEKLKIEDRLKNK